MADFATNSSTVDELDCATAVQSFEQDGFVAIPSLHSPQHIDSLCAVALENFETCIRTIEANGHSLGIGVKEGFKEIVQRHLNRFEMTFRMDQTPFLNLHKNETIMSFVHGILGPQASLVSTSILVSLPGTQDQGWHTDGPHMDIAKHLPCHCLNVFMPLVDISRENGPTEFRPGSHYMTRDLAKQYLAAFVSKRIRPIQSPCPKRGDAVAFDYRVLHRGAANRSAVTRPVMVFTYGAPWYKDNLNFPKRSLFDPPRGDHDDVHEVASDQREHRDDDNVR